MSRITKCDICGKMFDYGFRIDVSIQGGYGFTNIAEERSELGQKDICLDCYYKAREMIAKCHGQ